MFDKLTAIETRYESPMSLISDPAVQAEPAEYRKHTKALSEIQETVDAFRDHGTVRPNAVTEGLDDAKADLEALSSYEISLADVTATLLEEGIASFEKDFDALLETIARKLEQVRAGRERQRTALSTMLGPVRERLERIDEDKVVERIWRKDHTVWKDDPTEITDRLGWLTVTDLMHERLGELEAFAKQVAADGFETAVLLGMGGSSLAPEVFMRTFGAADGALELIVLDTTHPATIRRIAGLLELDPERVERPFDQMAAMADPPHPQFRRRHHDILGGVGAAKIDPERPVDHQRVEAKKADHRPRAHQEEYQPADEAETADESHDHDKAGAAQRAMRRDDRRKKRGLGTGVVVDWVLGGHAALNIGQTWAKRRPAAKRNAAPPGR